MILQENIPMLGVPSMNDMHLQEMILINKLFTAIGKRDIELTTILFGEFVKHTTTHYAQEETLMKEKSYPEYQHHKEEHDRVLREINMVLDKLTVNKDLLMASAYLEGALAPWTIHHMQTLDSEASAFIESN